MGVWAGGEKCDWVNSEVGCCPIGKAQWLGRKVKPGFTQSVSICIVDILWVFNGKGPVIKKRGCTKRGDARLC